MLYTFLRYILSPIARGLFRLQVIGGEYLPPTGGVILAANHVSLVDPLFLGLTVPRKLNFMAKEELFFNRLFGWLLRKLNAFPVSRNRLSPSTVKRALDLLSQGQVLLLFPEGTRGDGKNLQEPKPGIALIADRSGSPVIPAYHQGTANVMPRGVARIRPHPVTVCFGEPLKFPRDLRVKGVRDAYREFGVLVMERIAALKASLSERSSH
ncbi:MAG: 1-acyl-sn-glycerol-3-phosphate acyltransferase [candidate division NC10 bacterium]|nr:1-acyl-sn-glycerol-3-phosphate acyltransferase [candidate division NC10 bacterium]